MDKIMFFFYAAMMYAIVIIYGAVGMRFYTAIFAGWMGGLVGILVSNYLNGVIDWTFLNRTYTFSSFLGNDPRLCNGPSTSRKLFTELYD